MDIMEAAGVEPPDFERMLGKEIDGHCDKHGDFKAYEKSPRCLECIKEDEIEQERHRKIEQRALIQAEKWANAGMPSKFIGVRFEDWIVRTEAHAVTKEKAKLFLAGEYSRMALLGQCGTGKTMLVACVMAEWARSHPDELPVYTTATRMLRSIRDSWRGTEKEQAIYDKFAKAPLLVVDELGAGRCSDDDCQMLSEILCDRYGQDLPTVIVSNLTANELKGMNEEGERVATPIIDERASDRFREGTTVAAFNWKGERG